MKKIIASLIAALMLAALLCGCSAGTGATAATVTTEQAVPQSGSSLEAAADLILDIPTTQYFTMEAVASADIDRILTAGVNAPSAMNGQPWHFSAITDQTVIAEISGGMSFGGGVPAGMEGMPEGAQPPEGMGGMTEGAQPPEGMEGMPEGFEAPEGGFPGGMSGDMPAPPTGGGAKAGIEDAPLVIVISCKAGSEFDAGLACQNMSAQAQLMGYGTKIVSAPTMAINAQGREDLRATLGIPEGYTACALLLVGKTDTTVDTTADTYTGATARNSLAEVVTYLNP